MSEVNIKQTENISGSLEKPQVINGAGIRSIEQTSTSTEDNGVNTVTINLTDGTSQSFQVRNGSKGSTGKDGAQGPKGESGVLTINGVSPDSNGNVDVQSGVQSDWNQNDSASLDYVKNRPGGYASIIDPITITWDGVTDDKIKINVIDGAYFYYVSSEAVLKDQFVGGSYISTDESSNEVFEITGIIEIADGIFCNPDASVLIATTTGIGSLFGVQLTISQPGVYFIKVDGSSGYRVSSFTTASVTRITPIPMEYIENSENILLSTKPISKDLIISNTAYICSDGESPTKIGIYDGGLSVYNDKSSNASFGIGLGNSSDSQIIVSMSKQSSYITIKVPQLASSGGTPILSFRNSSSELGGGVSISGISDLKINGTIFETDDDGNIVLINGPYGAGQVIATKTYVDSLIGGIENGTY